MAHESQQVEIQQAVPSADDRAQDVGFARLAMRSLTQLILFNGVISVSVALLLSVMGRFARLLLASKETAFTTANLADVLLSWQGVLLIVINIVVVALYVAIDLFAHIFFCEGLLEEEEGSFFARAARALKRAFGALPRFMSLRGLPILVYIVLLAPLVGIGFSVGLTRDIYVPKFIMSVIEATPVYAIAYEIFIVVLFVVGALHFFSVFGILLDGLTPGEAHRLSRRIVRTNAKSILKSLLKGLAVMILLGAVVAVVYIAAMAALYSVGTSIPTDQEGALGMLINGLDPTDEAFTISLYHTACFFVNLVAAGITILVTLIAGSCAIMFATHLYKWHSTEQEEEPRYPIPTYKRLRSMNVLFALVAFVFFLVASPLLCVVFESGEMQNEPVAIIAHRMGGDAAPENSLEGLEYAIENGCSGAETDIQRTKDGHYIINHDDAFARLAGVKAAPQDLTLAEIQQLRVRDPNFPDEELEVPTLEDALDASKGRIKLFIELKGKTADHQMVDDAVRIIREHDAVDDVALISLSYDCISYAEETYPEFESGLLFFMEHGDVSLLKCDILLAEEETSTSDLIDDAHEAGKEFGVWTANEESDLRKVLASRADYVITDKIALAKSVQGKLDDRDDFLVITETVWGNVF